MENKESFISKSRTLGIDLTDEQYNQFNEFMSYMLKWNKRVKLTSITGEENIIDKHFIDSLSIFLSDKLQNREMKIMDLGTGGGFPGIPIKFINPKVFLTLLDARLKKIEYLQHLIEDFDLSDTEAIHGRAEELGQDFLYREAYDIVVARAVSNMSVLVEYALPFVKPGGYFIAMKSSDIEEELEEAKAAIKVLGGKTEKVKHFVLPETDMERSLIMIKKLSSTPKKYPRRAGKPKKDPIQ